MSLLDPSPVLVAAIPGMIAFAIWAVWDLQRFVLFGVLCAMILPEAIIRPGGTQVALADLLLLMALGVWLVTGAAGNAASPRLSGNRMLVPTLVFFAVNAESIAWSVRPGDTAKFAVQLFEIVVVIPIVFASLPQSLAVIRRGFALFIAITCVMAAVYIPYAGAGIFENPYLPEGLNKNAVGSFLAAGLVLAYALWLGEERRDLRLRYGLAALLELAGLLAAHSRGSLIGAFAAMIAVSLILGRHRFVTLVIALSAAAVFIGANGLTSMNADKPGGYDSSSVRVSSFRNAVDKIEDKPLLGSGAGTYSDFIERFHLFLPDPNNMFLLTWAEVGLVGILALLFLFWRFAAMFVSVRSLPEGASFLAVGAGGAALSMFVHFQFDVTWTRGTASLAFAMIGLMVALQRLAPQATEAPAPEPGPGLAVRSPAGVA